MKKPRLERDYYPAVARWLAAEYRCFKTEINKGLVYSRGDVWGVRDTGGSLSGQVETIAVEVKRGSEPFATAAGQAYGYRVYAERVYLADLRPNGFSMDEIAIAGHLGIGLIAIRASGRGGQGLACREVLTSPKHTTLEMLRIQLLDKLGLGACQVCGCYFELGKNFSATSVRWVNAVNGSKGIRFWNMLVAKRKLKAKLKSHDPEISYERRYFCPDCVSNLTRFLGEMVPSALADPE